MSWVRWTDMLSAGKTAIGLFEEFSHKAFQEPPDRTGGVQPGEEVIPKAVGEENPEESKIEETEPDEPKETDAIAEEPSGEPADFYFPEGWKLPEGEAKPGISAMWRRSAHYGCWSRREGRLPQRSRRSLLDMWDGAVLRMRLMQEM